MPAQLTQKDFVRLARAVQQHMVSLGVAVPKGSYCHILEATARGLGFGSKSALDTALGASSTLELPATLHEDAARQWLIKMGVPPPILDTFLSAPFGVLFPHAPISSRTPPMITPTKTATAQATSDIVEKYASKVWSTADTLRGVGAKDSQWPNHMMPFFALMLLESRALRARCQALDTFGGSFDPTDLQDVADLKAAYISAGGASSQTYHEDLIIHGQGLAHIVGAPAGFSLRLRAYLNGYDDVTRRLLGVNPGASGKAYLNIEGTVRFLEGHGGEHLWHYCKAWAQVNLVDYDSSAVTTFEEHIKRKWSDWGADSSGQHYSPADAIALVSAVAVDHFKRHPLNRQFLRIYDPTCGGGNMLFGVEDDLRRADESGDLRNANGEPYSIQSFGQEIDDTLFSLAAIESRFRHSATLREGNTLSDDKFSGEQFDLIVANPPYGTDWKQIKTDIDADITGRFLNEFRPPTSDGQHLFLQHIRHHLAEDGLALVFCNGSTLFSGDAGGGESNARSKYILTDDGVLGIIQMPKNEFFNTDISTYLWVFKKGKPEALKNRIFLLNAETLFAKLRKSLGSKTSEMTPQHVAGIVDLIRAAEQQAGALEAGGAPNGLRLVQTGVDGDLNAVVQPLKAGADGGAPHLRLLDCEQVHYNKVELLLTRGGERAIKKTTHLKKDVALRVFVKWATKNDDNPTCLWVAAGATVRDVRAALEKGRLEGLLDIDAIPENDPKAVTGALKQVIAVFPHKVFNSEGLNIPTQIMPGEGDWNKAPGYSHRMPDEENEVIDTLAEKSLGVGNLEIKIAIDKGQKGRTGARTEQDGGSSNRISLTAVIGPKQEKDTETTPYARDPSANQAATNQFLERWVKNDNTIKGAVLGCEINFNRFFPKTTERKTVAQINVDLAKLDAQLKSIKNGGAP